MDAIKFLKEKSRMCAFYSFCVACPLCEKNNVNQERCEDLEKTSPEELVSTVEKWSKENPIKTRQSEFLKMFPNVRMDGNGSVGLCPISVDSTIPRDLCYSTSCLQCKKDFWHDAVD